MNNIYMKYHQPKPFGSWIREYSFEPKEGYHKVKYAMMQMYTDVDPYEIIDVKGKKLLVRGMITEQVNELRCQVGGFSGHTENSMQSWNCFSDPKGLTFWISLRKDGEFRRVSGNTHTIYWLDEEPVKFYDYNF